MAHHAPVVKPADDPAFRLPAKWAALPLPLMIAGSVLLVVGFLVAYLLDDIRVAMSAYLTAFVYVTTIALGSLFFVIIQHLVRAGWSVVVRRVAELFMSLLLPLGVLFIPVLYSVLFTEGSLYVWDNIDYSKEAFPSEAWKEKDNWLNAGWFTVRSLIYFAIYGVLAWYYFRGSVEQDSTGQKVATERMQWWAGPATMVFALTTTFAAFDWVMSLAPMWFSTMFGVYMFAGSILAAHCVICLATFLLQRAGAMRDEVTVEHYHDLGKLIFGFVFFWTYISFSQYLLIWYGNIPEETEWFYHRSIGSWGILSIVIIFMHWMLPFAGTMSVHVRRRPYLMALWSAYLLIMHFVDVYWMIMPEARFGIAEGAGVDYAGVAGTIVCGIGMTTLAIGWVLKTAAAVKVVPVRDPRLAESLAFENI